MSAYLLLLVLYEEDFLEDVVLALTETGASGALVMDGMNMRQMMAFDIPIFAGFREELTEQPGYAKVVLAQVGDAGHVDRFLGALADGGTDWQRDGLGRLMLLPLTMYIDSNTRLES